MKRFFVAVALVGAIGLVAACATRRPAASTGTAAPVYSAPAPAPAPSGGGSCGGAGKA